MKETSEQYTVTAVIITHNRRELLERAVRSVLTQDYPALDLVVVDDASTDSTQAYLTRLAAEDSRVTYVRIPAAETNGANHARNVGIKAAKGRFVAFLDDDDEWLPTKTSEQIAFFRRHPSADAVSTDWYEVFCFPEKEYCFRKNYRFSRGKNEFLIEPCVSLTIAIMVRKELLDRIGGFDETLKDLHEVELSYRLYLHGKVGFLNKPLVRYYHFLNNESISCKADNYIQAREAVGKKYAAQLSELTPDQKKRYESAGIKEVAYRYLKADEKSRYRAIMKPHLGQFGLKEQCTYLLSYLIGYRTLIRIKIMLSVMKERLKPGDV